MRRLVTLFLVYAQLASLGSISAPAQTAISNGAALSNGARIIPPPQALCLITTNSLPGATQGVFYSQQIQTSGCVAPITFSITAGALPTWVTTAWPNTTGLIQGTPGPGDVGTSANFTVTATDANGHQATFNAAFDVATGSGAGAPALPDPALTGWNTSVANTPSPNTVIAIGSDPTWCNQWGGCTYGPTQLASAALNVSCGQTLVMQDNVLYPVSGTVTFAKVCDSAHWITVTRDFTDTNFPPEGTRVTPCYSGIASLPGYPSYPCFAPARHMPYVQKTNQGATINMFGSFYRFVGIEWGHTNGYDLDFGVLNMANSTACSAPDTACMNAQPTFNIFDRNIFHGDAQRQTAKAIALGGTRWVSVQDSYVYDISETFAGGGGDANPFGWGNGKNFTNSGWGKFQNNFEAASTMGNLFCGAFTEPVSPSTGFDGVPHDFWFSQDWFYKPLTWDTQRFQTQAVAQTNEGVTYPPAADQEFIMQPAAMQLQTGQTLVVHTWMANDSNAGVDRSPAGSTTLACGGCANPGTVTTVFQNVGSGNYVAQNEFTITYTAPATVPTGNTVTLTRTFSTWDGRASTIGNARTMSASTVFTIVSGTVSNQISLFPKASDLQIQPSYTDANFNNRQFELEFTSIQNFNSVSLTWKVDGIAGGNTSVGQMCGISSTTTCLAPGSNDPQAIYWSGTQTGAHTISVTSAAGTTDSSVISVMTTAPIVEWDGKANTSKNGWELKCGRKFLVENNLIENDWGAEGNGNGQGGQLLLIHPLNQNGCMGSGANCQTSVLSGNTPIGYGPFEIADGTLRYIKGIHHGAGMVIGGSSNTLGIRRVSIHDVLCDDCSYVHNSHGFGLNTYFNTQFNSGGPTVYSWESATNPMASNISYRHLTSVGDVPVNNTAHGGVFGVAENTAQAAVKPFGYTMQDSFFAANSGVNFYDPNGAPSCNIANGSGANNTEARGMVPCFTLGGYVMNHLNLTDSPSASSVFASSPIWQVAGASIGFVNYLAANGGDYRPCKGLNNPVSPCPAASPFAAGQLNQASDGGDLGADINGINAVEQSVRSGVRTGLPFAIATSSLPNGAVGSSYSQTLSVSGGTAPYTWSTPANVVPPGAIDILDYAMMPLPDQNNFCLNGASNPKCFKLDAGLLWWMKSTTGEPWDGELVGSDYIKQWFTENVWLNPSSYKMYVNAPSLWKRYHVPGADDVVYTPGPNKYATTVNCGADNQPLIDNLGIRGELTGPFNDVTWKTTCIANGGNSTTCSIPDNQPYLLAQKWIKCTANNILNCTNEEDYWLVKGYGQAQWCPKTLTGGVYVTGACSQTMQKIAQSAVTPNFACGVPNPQVSNPLPPATPVSSSTPFTLGDSTGTLSASNLTTAGTYVFTVQVEDANGLIAYKTLSITVH